MIQRVPTYRPLSSTESVIAALLATGRYNYHSLAEHMACSWKSVKTHVYRAALKIPGDLPAQVRLVVWYRGATLDVLTGSAARQEGYQPTHGPG